MIPLWIIVVIAIVVFIIGFITGAGTLYELLLRLWPERGLMGKLKNSVLAILPQKKG